MGLNEIVCPAIGSAMSSKPCAGRLEYTLHTQQDLFDQAYVYIEQYY